MSEPYKCPICLGCGKVPGGFYNATIGHILQWSSSSSCEQCRQCNGTGIIWSNKESDNV